MYECTMNFEYKSWDEHGAVIMSTAVFLSFFFNELHISSCIRIRLPTKTGRWVLFICILFWWSVSLWYLKHQEMSHMCGKKSEQRSRKKGARAEHRADLQGEKRHSGRSRSGSYTGITSGSWRTRTARQRETERERAAYYMIGAYNGCILWSELLFKILIFILNLWNVIIVLLAIAIM